MQLYPLGTHPEVLNGFIINTILVVSTTAVVGLRIWARWMKNARLWLDDYTCIISICLLYALCGIQIADAQYGMRTETTELPTENVTAILKTLVAGQILYGAAVLFSKASFLFFYGRIFQNNSIRFATWILLAILAGWFLANTLQVFLMCHPFASNWDTSMPSSCGNRPIVYTAIGAVNVLTSLALILLPLPFVRALQIPLATKVGLAIIYLLGFFICAISIVRTLVHAQLSLTDTVYDMPSLVFWTVVEPALLTTTACLPALRPVFEHVFTSERPTGDNTHSSRRHSHVPNPAHGAFERMNDNEYPLTDTRDVLHKLKITSSESEVDDNWADQTRSAVSRSGRPRTARPKSQCKVIGGSLRRKESSNGLGGMMEGGGVTVKTEWTVVEDARSEHA